MSAASSNSGLGGSGGGGGANSNPAAGNLMEIKMRCDITQEKLDYYINQYTTTMGQLEVALQDSSVLREKYTETSNEKMRLQQKVNHLERKLSRIIESMKLENGNSQTICAFLEQYNELKKKYEQNRLECEKMSKETESVKKKCNELIEDRNSLALEKDDLKHQLLMAIRQMDMVQRERDDRVQILKQNDDIIKELNQVLNTKIIELRRSTEQRNAAEQELSLILSEKDTVLKENQKLSDDLVMVVKKSNEMEARYKDEKQNLFYDNERLKRELETSIRCREEIVKECESLREKVEDLSSLKGDSSEHMLKGRSEFKSTSNESWSKEMTDTKEFNLEQHVRDLEAANQEIEILRKQLDKTHNEMVKATQDTELAKSRRDWAITEREKIVQERDSVKILCDELRKERDTAISELLAAIRDSESIKKQKDDACKEIEQLREHLESQLSTSAAQLANPTSLIQKNHGRWSCASYDGDAFRKTDTEVIDIDINGLPSDGELGLVLDGGRDENQLNTDNTRVYVVSIAKDSVCDEKLRPNDCIIKVNNLDCSNVSRRIVLESIRSSAPRCKVVVKRQLMNASHLYEAQLNLKCGRGHGLSFESGIYISKIDPGSLAARDNNLAVGDRIISINKRSMEGIKNPNDVLMYLDDNRNESAIIVALKQIGQMNANKLMYNKLTNVCTQTDESPLIARLYDENNKRLSIPSSGLNSSELKAVQTGSASQGMTTSSSPSTTATPSAKSTSKLTELFKIIRGKSQKYATEVDDSVSSQMQNENEAISLLDSVLNSENSSSSKLKRNKRKKDSKDSSNGKNMGTWPRANIIAHEDLSGTIVQNRNRERPTLSVFNSGISPPEKESKTKATRDNDKYFDQHPIQLKSQVSIGNTAFTSPVQNPRNQSNSNPVPYRHSVYGSSLESDPILLSKSQGQSISHGSHHLTSSGGMVNTISRIPRSTDYERHHHNQMNRMSLNFTPSDQSLVYNMSEKKPQSGSTTPNQQYFADLVAMKNPQHPYLVPKIPLDLPMKPPSKEALDFYGMKRFQKNVSKYPSDSDNLGPMENHSHGMSSGNTSTLPSYSRIQSMYGPSSRTQNMIPKFVHPHPVHGNHISPLASPITTQPADSTGVLAAPSGSIPEKSEFESYVSGYHHSHGNSIDYPYHRSRYQAIRDEIPSHYSGGYEGGTFPRKKENQRFRIPSNHSVTSRGSGVKNSTGSIEHHGSERGSPMPIFQVEVLSHGSHLNKRSTMTEYCYGQKPNPGDLRRVTIDKSVEPLGITIRCKNNGGGIFVSTVTENSIASQVGLQTGDQLLEVCGLNMRSATYDLAASVLRQCGNSMTMLVQYNPDKYDVDAGQSTDDESITPSGSTPRNSPGENRNQLRLPKTSIQPNPNQKSPTSKQIGNVAQIIHRSLYAPSSSSSVPNSPSILSTSSSVQNEKVMLIPTKNNSNIMNTNPVQVGVGLVPPGGMNLLTEIDSLKSISNTPSATNIYQEEPRMLIIETKKKALGISFVGGNKTGIFVHRVVQESLGDSAGIRVGDQILEFNGTDLRIATAEQAYLEIAKPTDKVSVVVQHNMQKFNQIDPDQESIDSLYIKVAFDRTGELGESELRFSKDDVLYVDNTMFTGTPGLWRAWTLDEYGLRVSCGLIPSQSKVEEDIHLRLHQDTADSDNTSRRGTTSARRSFFRRKKHQRSSSRDSKELASFSNTQLSWFSDSGMLNDESSINSYIRMDRLDYPTYRPILVLGPLAECVVDKLHIDFPKEFERCKLQPMNCTEETLENNLHNNVYVDYRRRGSIFECTTVQAIRDVRDKKRHCILDICISAVERLQRMQIYPIVLLLRFRSAKQIKEVKDSRYSTDKISAKAAKEMYEHAQKLESEFGHLISVIIPAGVNIHHMSSQVKAAVENEQKKVLWIPFTGGSSSCNNSANGSSIQ